MKQLVAAVTARGQVTIPSLVRRTLGIKPSGKVTFVIDHAEVRLIPTQFTLEAAYGSVTPKQRPEDFQRMIDEAMEEHAADVVRELRKR